MAKPIEWRLGEQVYQIELGVKVYPQGSPVEDVITEAAGKVPELLASTFDQENKLEPLSLSTLIGFNVRDSYPLSSSTLP